MKGGGERQQMEEMTLNKQFSLDDSKTSDRLLKWGSWENCVPPRLESCFERGSRFEKNLPPFISIFSQ